MLRYIISLMGLFAFLISFIIMFIMERNGAYLAVSGALAVLLVIVLINFMFEIKKP